MQYFSDTSQTLHDIHFRMSPADLWHGFYKTTSSVFTFEDGTSCTSGVYGSVHKAYPWHSGEPDSSSPCIRLKYMGSQQFVWADYGCSSTFRFLCQGKFRDIVYWEKSIQIRKLFWYECKLLYLHNFPSFLPCHFQNDWVNESLFLS